VVQHLRIEDPDEDLEKRRGGDAEHREENGCEA